MVGGCFGGNRFAGNAIVPNSNQDGESNRFRDPCGGRGTRPRGRLHQSGGSHRLGSDNFRQPSLDPIVGLLITIAILFMVKDATVSCGSESVIACWATYLLAREA